MNTGTLKTADGMTLHTVNWAVDSPKAIVFLVHGIGEHSGRYGHVAASLNARGYSVYALDHRGHGRSEGKRRWFDDFQRPVDDLKQYFDLIRTQHPTHKIFVYGHSMGSLLSTLFCLRYQDQLAGFITSGSPLAIDEGRSPLFLFAASLMARVMPDFKMQSLEIGTEALTRDPEMMAAYDSDPLNDHNPTSLGMANRLLNAARDTRKRLNTLKLPMLILHGTGDQICPPSASKLLYALAASPDKTLKLYDGLHHELHNEIERESVLADIGQWLDAHA